MGRCKNEVIVAYFRTLSLHSSGRTEEKNEGNC